MPSERNLFSKAPELYQQYIKEEILNPDLKPSQYIQEGQLVNGTGEKAIFLDIPMPEITSHHIVKGNTIRISQPSTLSDKLIAFDSSHRKLKLEISRKFDMFVFAKSMQDKLYTFVGGAEYMSISHGLWAVTTDFVLGNTLPETVMKSLKGYEWKVYDTIDFLWDQKVMLYTFNANDALKFAKKMLKRHGDVTVSRFDGQELVIHLLDGRAYMSYTGIGINFVGALDSRVQNSDVILNDPFPDVYDTIPLSQTIPRDDAIKAMNEFIETGQRPTCVQWRD